MDKYEKIGYSLLGLVALIYVLAIVIGMLAAFPYGLIGLVLLVGLGALLLKVFKERLENKEDDHYAATVKK